MTEDFNALRLRLYALYEVQGYAEALDLALAGLERFPDQIDFLRYFGACMAGCVGDGPTALRLLREKLDAGVWTAAALWEDSDFNAVRDLPEFQALRARSLAMEQAARAHARPERLIVEPGGAVNAPTPLLIALHGNMSSIRWHRAHWESAARAGWLVGMPQSDEVSGLDSEGNLGYLWNDVPRAEAAVVGFYAALSRAYALDPARLAVGGFSRGAETAIMLAATGQLPVQGFVAVCPGGPWTQNPALWEPIVAQAQGRDLRGVVIMGEQDRFVDGTLRLVDLLRDAGVRMTFERHAALGHDYPPGFADRLPQTLKELIS